MGQPRVPVTYDFGAADDLAAALAEARRRIEQFANLRATQRKAMLGAQPCDKWQGRRRDDFDHRFGSEQQTLHGLAGEVNSLLRAVEQATAQAREQSRV